MIITTYKLKENLTDGYLELNYSGENKSVQEVFKTIDKQIGSAPYYITPQSVELLVKEDAKIDFVFKIPGVDKSDVNVYDYEDSIRIAFSYKQKDYTTGFNKPFKTKESVAVLKNGVLTIRLTPAQAEELIIAGDF